MMRICRKCERIIRGDDIFHRCAPLWLWPVILLMALPIAAFVLCTLGK